MRRTPLDVGWRRLSRGGEVRCLKYSWGPATANALAIRLAPGWLVVSAPIDPDPATFDELADDGGVVALLAPNGFHHLGQAAWRRRFPAATSWAPRGALARLAAKSPGIPFRAAEELALPHGVEILVPDGQKRPDLLLRATTLKDGVHETVWWLGDLFSNTTDADQNWPLRWLSRLLGSGTGYRRNARPGLVYVADRDAWLGSVRAALTAHPPTIVVPAHGDPIVEDAARRTAAILA